ncbi:MAG TPA: thymidylate synthase [Bacteroidota bacterium]|nr:thymidylate synthase [Bacteroidota bacterium]
MKEQLKRVPKPPPRIAIERVPIDELQFENVSLIGYESYEPIKFEVAV